MRFKLIKNLVEIVGLGIGFQKIAKCAYGTLNDKELQSVFEKFSRSYQKSAAGMLDNAQSKNPDTFNNVLFHLSSIGTAVLFGYRGDYDNANKICQFALDNIPTKSSSSPNALGVAKEELGIFHKLMLAYDLRRLALEIEKENPNLTTSDIHQKNYCLETQEKLQVLKAALHNTSSKKSQIGKPGELALLYFIMGDKEAAKEQLDVLFDKAKQTTKYLQPEVFENQGFAYVSPVIGKSYVEFAQNFITLKDQQIKTLKNKAHI